ncbi:hypothetical protein ACFS5M_11455 [Lacinutrix iliipiscaria]|uniref:Secreted protein n=1 Tax=Lacinutrix iliipiscaria TaxID=1230532 RepID=A0ABW5WSJ0_9FLAO
MKYFCLLTLFLVSINSFSQKEGQLFCDGDPNSDYFTLLDSNKYIIWRNTYYVEKMERQKQLNGKTYVEYSQSWESGDVVKLYLKKEKGVVYQFEDCCDDDTVRMPNHPQKGDTWKTADGLVTYEVISIESELKTPVCSYKNLLELKSIFSNGEFTFFYQKGYGYVGAKEKDILISFVVPRSPKE